MSFIHGEGRGQATLFPVVLDDLTGLRHSTVLPVRSNHVALRLRDVA
jgi:hypothetical protein